MLGPLLYTFYTADIPTHDNVDATTFADDIALVARSENYDEAVAKLQTDTDKAVTWAQKWKIRLNSDKSARVDFALRPHGHIPTYIYGQAVNATNTAKYFGVHLDSKLNWQKHLETKLDELKL